jgi:hypothetical protein
VRIYHGSRSTLGTKVFYQHGRNAQEFPLKNTYGDGTSAFDWGDESEGAAALAHSLLIDAIGLLSVDAFFEDFMLDQIVSLPYEQWTLPISEIHDYARKKYLEALILPSLSDEDSFDDPLTSTIRKVKELQALAIEENFEKSLYQPVIQCENDDARAFSPWYYFHPKADPNKDHILAWLKDCEAQGLTPNSNKE